MIRTGGTGEFIAGAPGRPAFAEAARLLAQAGWRAEVHSLSATDFQQEIEAYEAAHARFPIGDLRWVIVHVPFITEPWVNRLKAIGGGLAIPGGNAPAERPAVPHDRGQRNTRRSVLRYGSSSPQDGSRVRY